jgi:hypothetical protein
MVLQLYDQIPIQAVAPKHAEAKGHSHEPLQPRAGNSFSGLTSMKDTTANMEKYQESDMGNTHGMNGDFMKTNCRLYVQGQSEPHVAQYNHRSKYEVNNPCSPAPFPI